MAANMKKRRTERIAEEEQPNAQEARRSLFKPFRALGYVTRDVPFSIQARGQAHFMLTCLDYSFQIYDCMKLATVLVGPTVDKKISCAAVHGDLTFIAAGPDILVFNRTSEEKRLKGPTDACIKQLLSFGDVLVSVYEDNKILTWKVSESQVLSTIEFDRRAFALSTALHPSTYLNKLLLASEQGEMELWNIATGKRIYRFSQLGSAVTCLAQSPVIDVVAIGLQDGTVLLHNVRLDESVLTVKQEGRVTSISFRTDEVQLMAVGNASGDVTLWDLEHQRLQHTLSSIHDGRVHLQFLNGQPILITTGINSIKQWIFDGTNDNVPRILRARGGHSLPPTMLRMYDASGNFILTASGDRSFRILSTRRDRQCAELSQGTLASNASRMNVRADDLRLSAVVAVDACELKEGQWDNIVTAHSGSSEARSWSFQRRAIGQHCLKSRSGSPIKSVALSACGSFALLGLVSGDIDIFNLQSGIYRRSLTGANGHTKAVTGVATDATNRTVYSTSLDGTMKIWELSSGKLLGSIPLSSPVNGLCFNHDSDLLAVMTDDLCIHVVDAQTQRVVREFVGHTNRITDFAFTPDGRWIVSASLDGTVRTWDLSTGHLVDWFATESVCVSLAFVPDGSFLATAHVDQLGVFLWANRAHYANVPLRRIPTSEPCRLQLPNVSAMLEADEQDARPNTETPTTETHAVYTTPDQLVSNMVTLSSLPQSMWQRLLHLDTIKKRNKPQEPAKKPKAAPFFLQTQLDESGPRFVKPTETTASTTNVIRLSELHTTTEFGRLLRAGESSGNFLSAMEHLELLNPSGVDFAIRSLSPTEDCYELKLFLEAIRSCMQSRTKFDASEAYLNVFLKVHSDLLLNSNELAALLASIKQVREKGWSQIESLFQSALCLVDFGRNVYA